jgi:hypothetical protein
MKRKAIISTLLICFITVALYGQKNKPGFRKQRPAETAFLNMLHKTLFESLPHTYKNWTTGKEDPFDATKYWCGSGGPISWHDCTGDIPTSIGIADPYSLSWQVDFKMPDEEAGGLMSAAVRSIKDFSNGQQIAAALKATNKAKLSIFIVANLFITGTSSANALSYCAKTPLVSITLPVPSTLALKGLRSVDCPIMESGRVSMSGNYYDNAIIFLGKPVIAKKTETTSDGLTATRYSIGFDRAKIGKFIVQNIAITINGDSADIDEAIKLIDWQKLYDVIDKNN